MSELAVGSLKGLAANDFKIEVASGSQIVQPGAILQVVQAFKTDTFARSSTTYGAVTGLGATITPSSATSKILIMAEVRVGAGVANADGAAIRIAGGNSATYIGDAEGSRISAVAAITDRQAAAAWAIERSMHSMTIQYLDSPATTSAVTYNVEIRGATANAVYVNRGLDDGNTTTQARGASSIILMEVAG